MYKKIILTAIVGLLLNSCSKKNSEDASSTATPAPVAPAPVVKTEHRMFVTSNAYQGNLGGLSGADTICNNEATAAGLTGAFKAFLVDQKNMPLLTDRFPNADQLPVNSYDNKNAVNNIANSFSDLITNQDNFNSAVTYSASGDAVDNFVWTGLQPDGSSTGSPTCLDWTSSDIKNSGRVGKTSGYNAGAVKDSDTVCSIFGRLYCVD